MDSGKARQGKARQGKARLGEKGSGRGLALPAGGDKLNQLSPKSGLVDLVWDISHNMAVRRKRTLSSTRLTRPD